MEIHIFTAKQILWGNILLMICCMFYLAWWILAFKPTGAIKGMRTGWLLIPATVAGVFAVILVVKGVLSASADAALFPKGALLWGGVAAYLILLAVTCLLFKRQVTTELFLIVGWAVLALSEISVLYGMGQFSYPLAAVFAASAAAAAAISIGCYVLYYKLGDRAGYFDGMIPLILTAAVLAGISAAIVIKSAPG